MMPERGSLGWLLHPLSVDAFIHDIWASRHHSVERHCPDYFNGLFDAAAIERYMEYARPDHSEIRLVRMADKKPLEAFRNIDGRIDFVRVRNDFGDGYTIILNGLEHHIPSVAALAREIEIELNFEAQINAYITPPQSQGFLPHYDDHDVLVLQLEGGKTWHIYDSMDDVPTHELRLRELFIAGDLPTPTDLRLTAGDTLYIPRGRVHAASAEQEASIHLTIGIHPPSVLMLASKALEALSFRDDRLLSRLPPRYLRDASARALLTTLVREAAALIDDQAVGDAIGALEDKLVRRGRCQPAGQLVANASEVKKINGETHVRKCQPIYSRVLAMNGGVALQFAQSLVSAGNDHKDAMLFISRNDRPFKVGELPGLTQAQQTDLAQKLVLDGLLVRVGQE